MGNSLDNYFWVVYKEGGFRNGAFRTLYPFLFVVACLSQYQEHFGSTARYESASASVYSSYCLIELLIVIGCSLIASLVVIGCLALVAKSLVVCAPLLNFKRVSYLWKYSE